MPFFRRSLPWLIVLAAAVSLAMPAATGSGPVPSLPPPATVPLPPAGTVTLAFWRDGQPAQVERALQLSPDRAAAARLLLETLLAGPTPQETVRGITSAFPPAAALAALEVDGPAVTATVVLPAIFLDEELDALLNDQMVWQLIRTLEGLDLRHFSLLAVDPRAPEQARPVSDFLDRPPLSPWRPLPDDIPAPPQRDTVAGQPPVYGQGQPQGALSGKTVYLSPGHGWYWAGSHWTTQRGISCDLVEDFANAEAVNYYLARYLWNAGAEVWTVRERDMNTAEVIVDNNDGPPGYQTVGPWYTSLYTGYLSLPYSYTWAASTETAIASWTPDLPGDGSYGVYVWYRPSPNRVTDALYRVHHAGGVTEMRVNQEERGWSWLYLGTYYFLAGTAGRLELSNLSDEPGQAVIADAVRFGGGMGSIQYGGGTSNRPRYAEACLTWAPFQGAPSAVYPNDVVCRPLYAEWEKSKAPGQDAVYISWHSNAMGSTTCAGTGTGTETFIYNTNPTPGSAALQHFVHTELINDIRTLYPGWVDRGKKSADFGEVRELSTMPGVLLEIAFHDNPSDALALKQPDFRRLSARAVYQGIVRYYADRDSLAPRLLPEPPCYLTARNSGPGQVTLTWRAPVSGEPWGDPAEWYKVYVGTTGYAFDNGHVVSDTHYTMNGLAPDTLYFFRVTALNQGGESFPCLTAAVRTTADGGRPPALLVDGFDRIDGGGLIYEYEPRLGGSSARMYLARMNTFDYAVQHGRSLDACGQSFDFAANEAVIVGDATLGVYAALIWILGEESTADETFSSVEQALVSAYLDGGGRLLVSGAEIGWDLDDRGSPADRAFYNNYLRASYVGDDAETYQVVGSAGGIFAGLSFSFDDGTHGTYDVDWPDQIAPLGGATVCLEYQGGLGGNAGIQYSGHYRLVYLGFPFETIYPAEARHAVMARVAAFLVPPPTPTPTPTAGPSPTPTPTPTAGPSPTPMPTPTLGGHRAYLPLVEHAGEPGLLRWLGWWPGSRLRRI